MNNDNDNNFTYIIIQQKSVWDSLKRTRSTYIEHNVATVA